MRSKYGLNDKSSAQVIEEALQGKSSSVATHVYDEMLLAAAFSPERHAEPLQLQPEGQALIPSLATQGETILDILDATSHAATASKISCQ